MKKYKAKVLCANLEEEEFYKEGRKKGHIDEEGYIYGCFVDGHIVCGVTENCSDEISLEYWYPVDEDSLVEVG